MKSWETTLLSDANYYTHVLIDGCVIQHRDVELCDLRCFVDKYRGSEKPALQVYKHNKGGREYCEMFYSFPDAVANFKEMAGINE